MHFKLEPIVDGLTVGGLAGALFGIFSPWFWVTIFVWTVVSAWAHVYDFRRRPGVTAPYGSLDSPPQI